MVPELCHHLLFSSCCCCDKDTPPLLKWGSVQAPSPSHTAQQSGFPSHSLQPLNINSILWGFACRGFHTSLPEHWARVAFQKANAAPSTGNSAPASTSETKGGKQPKNQFMLFMWGRPELTSGVSEVPNTITTHRNDQFLIRLPRQSFLSHVSQSLFTTYTHKTQKGTCRDTLLHFSKFPTVLLLKKINYWVKLGQSFGISVNSLCLALYFYPSKDRNCSNGSLNNWVYSSQDIFSIHFILLLYFWNSYSGPQWHRDQHIKTSNPPKYF